uniref:Uncharacterized protein n=1 Tax=Solanum lycopersicum TaxID=4081 RepID=A0A3Q7HMB2_SOLLC
MTPHSSIISIIASTTIGQAFRFRDDQAENSGKRG